MIRVHDLRCGYSEHPVLNGVCFHVHRGEFVGILGPNGCGKTTLLLALSGIIPAREGVIEIMEKPVETLRPRDRARFMAMVAQDVETRFGFSCEEVVRMGRYPHQKRWHVETGHDEAMVAWALKAMEVEELSGRMITAISGGERQRVMAARALAQETPLLLLDEATSAMDVHRKLQTFNTLDHLNRENSLTILAVLHDINLAALFCQRLIFMKDGLIVADGPTGSVLQGDILESVYQTRVLIQEVEGIGKRQVVFLPR